MNRYYLTTIREIRQRKLRAAAAAAAAAADDTMEMVFSL